MTFLALTGLLNLCGNAFLGCPRPGKEPAEPDQPPVFLHIGEPGDIQHRVFLLAIERDAGRRHRMVHDPVHRHRAHQPRVPPVCVYPDRHIREEKERARGPLRHYRGIYRLQLRLAALRRTGTAPRPRLLAEAPPPFSAYSSHTGCSRCSMDSSTLSGASRKPAGASGSRSNTPLHPASSVSSGARRTGRCGNGIDLPPYANILILVYPAVMAYAIIRYRLMEIRLALTRTGIFLVIYSMVLGIPFIIGFRSNFGFLSFLTLFILATFGPPGLPHAEPEGGIDAPAPPAGIPAVAARIRHHAPARAQPWTACSSWSCTA